MNTRHPRTIIILLITFMILESVSITIQTYTANAAVVTTSLSDMLARAETIVNCTWVPTQDIDTWNENSYNGSTVFKKGIQIQLMYAPVIFVGELAKTSRNNMANLTQKPFKFLDAKMLLIVM